MKQDFKRQRNFIKTAYSEGDSIISIKKYLDKVFRNDAYSIRSIRHLINDFNGDKNNVEKSPKNKRKRVVRTRKIIECVKNLLNKEPHINVREIATILEISPSSAYRIITEDLGLKLVFSKFVPKCLNSAQKKERVSCSEKLLQIFENREYYMRKAIAIDETWISSFSIKSKRKKGQYLGKGAAKIVLEKESRFQKKWFYAIAFNKHGETFQKNLRKDQSLNSK